MNNEEYWQKKLAEGEWFENHVARPWLLTNRPSFWITDSRNHVRGQGSAGPHMSKAGQDVLVLPDFRWDDPITGASGWYDGKMKNQPFSISGQTGRLFYSIDARSYPKYMKLLQVFPYMSLEILLGCRNTNMLWLFDLRTTQPVMHEFNNQYVRGGRNLTPCFATDQMKMVGKWNSRDMP